MALSSLNIPVNPNQLRAIDTFDVMKKKKQAFLGIDPDASVWIGDSKWCIILNTVRKVYRFYCPKIVWQE